MALMSSNASPDPRAGSPNPYSREAAPGQGLGEEPRELDADEVAAATAWAASLQPDSGADPAHADPYAAYADPYDQQQWDPYSTGPYGTGAGSNPYTADPYANLSPYAGQHPAANPYASVNLYAVTPAQAYGPYTPYQQPKPNHPMAVPSLVLSLISYMFCPLLGVVGMIMGFSALNGVNAEPERYGGKGMAIAGLVLGGIATVLSIAGVLFFVLLGAA